MEEFIKELTNLDPLLVYLAVGAIAYLENVLPPFPGDLVVVFAGSLAAIGTIDFTLAVAVTTVASTLGFMTMYEIGHWFGQKILEAGKIRFIPKESVEKVESWFRRYGYSVIVANRFLAGTRAVVSFFAGMSTLSLTKTSLLSFCSALVWNMILLYAGKTLGDNWESIGFYLQAYGSTVTSIIIIIVLLLVARYIYQRTTQSAEASKQNSKR